jgi:uncharacterized protein (TIGR00369 family)
MLERERDGVLNQPVHRGAGLEIVTAAEGRCEIRYQVNDTTANPHGMLHGGIICLMHDVADFLAVASLLPADKHAVTAETHTSILRPANRGETITVRAQVDRVGKTLAFMRCETFATDASGKQRLIATGSLTKAVTAVRH